MGLFKKKQVKELYWLKHFHDSNNDSSIKEEQILTNTVSPYLFENDTMEEYLNLLSTNVYQNFDQHNVLRNLKNPTVDKNYDNHKN